MPEPTVEEVLNIDASKPIPKPSSVAAIVAFWLFAPIGVYLLWKEKTFHHTFALLTLILGVFNFLGYFSILFFLPTLHNLSGAMISNDQINYGVTFLILTICLIQILTSFLLRKSAKKKDFLNKLELTTLAAFVLLVDFIIIPLIFGVVIGNIILPFYQRTLDPYKNFPERNTLLPEFNR